MEPDGDLWYTVEELAKRWKLHAETIRRLIRAGELRAMQLPRAAGYRISADEVRRFEQAREGKHGD